MYNFSLLPVPVEIPTLQQQLVSPQKSLKPQPDRSEQVIRDLQKELQQNQQTIEGLQRQLNQYQETVVDLQRRRADTERDFKHQLDEERRHHDEQLERIRRQSSSGEVEFWTVPRDDVKIDSEIGFGGWGSVCKGTFHSRAVAVKRLHPAIVSADSIGVFAVRYV